MSGCPHFVISGASSSGRPDSKRFERVLSVSRRSIKLRLLFSLCVVGWVISSSHHVQEFVGSGIEPAADVGRESASCIELAGSAGLVGSGIEPVAEFGRKSAACIELAGSAGFEVQHNYKGRRARAGSSQPRLAPGSTSLRDGVAGPSVAVQQSSCPTAAASAVQGGDDGERYDTRFAGALQEFYRSVRLGSERFSHVR